MFHYDALPPPGYRVAIIYLDLDIFSGAARDSRQWQTIIDSRKSWSSGIERRLMLSVGQRPALVVVVVVLVVSYTLIETLLMKLFLPGFGLRGGMGFDWANPDNKDHVAPLSNRTDDDGDGLAVPGCTFAALC
uniref:Uncharacterized protein n=1 Tax=Anopheles merus TaxID=30066 RepID=A0A182VAP9_ANOME